MRKEVDTICYNPTGELIPSGEGLNVKEIIRKTGGSLRKKNYNISAIKDDCINESLEKLNLVITM